jgi:hypothetical protein
VWSALPRPVVGGKLPRARLSRNGAIDPKKENNARVSVLVTGRQSGMRMRVATSAYLALAIGSISLFLIASAAPGEAKNAINRLALSTFRAGHDGGREHLGNWISGPG